MITTNRKKAQISVAMWSVAFYNRLAVRNCLKNTTLKI